MLLMHILAIPSWFPSRNVPSGDGTYFAEQAEILRRVAGWRCDILAPRIFPMGKGDGAGMDVESLPDGGEVWRGAFPYRFPLNRVSAWQKFGGEMFAAYAEKRGAPDFIWAHGLTQAGWLARDLRRRLGIPYFLHEHLTRYQKMRRVSFFRRMDLRRTVRSAVYCATVSAQHRQAVARQLGIPQETLEVVHNPVNGIFAESVSRPARDRLGGVFISVGRLVHVKNQAAILQGFARFLREEDSEAKLRLVGDGPDRDKLAGLIQELGLEDSAELTGNLGREKIREALLAADAFVFPSAVESFGVALMEALCCGLPCAATAAGIAGEVVDETTGILLSDASPEAILAGMKKIRRTRYDPAAIRRRGLAVSSPERFCETIKKILARRGGGCNPV